MEKADLKTKSYKDIDKFLWLYGVVMNEFWKKQGVITYDSIYYIAPKEMKM